MSASEVMSLRLFCLALLVRGTLAAITLAEHIEELDKSKSACSACNQISRTLDGEALGSQLVSMWKSSTAEERSKELKKTLKRACRAIAKLELGQSKNVGLSSAFVDLLDMRKKGIDKMFDNMETGPAVNQKVQTFCELIVNEHAVDLVERMETWRAAGKKRRIVDFRFNTDSRLCSGGILSVCDDVFKEQHESKLEKVDDDDDDDDDRDEL